MTRHTTTVTWPTGISVAVDARAAVKKKFRHCFSKAQTAGRGAMLRRQKRLPQGFEETQEDVAGITQVVEAQRLMQKEAVPSSGETRLQNNKNKRKKEEFLSIKMFMVLVRK